MPNVDRKILYARLPAATHMKLMKLVGARIQLGEPATQQSVVIALIDDAASTTKKKKKKKKKTAAK